jgi:hypothetical protein
MAETEYVFSIRWVKVMFVSLIKHHTMKMYGERRYSSTIFDPGTR